MGREVRADGPWRGPPSRPWRSARAARAADRSGRRDGSPRTVGGATLAAWALAWGAGIAAQLQQATLWSTAVYAAVLVPSLVAALVLVGAIGVGRGAGVGRVPVWLAVAAAIAGTAFGTTGLRAGHRLAQALPAALEGQDLELTGVIASLPQRLAGGGWRFVLEVEAARQGDAAVAVPPRVSLAWYGGGGGGGRWAAGRDEAADVEPRPPVHEVPALRAGERWRLPVRLRQPNGTLNPHGFDAELWWFEQGLRAVGSVRGAAGAAPPQRLASGQGQRVERARQALREAIEARIADPRTAGVVTALAVGDQAAIDGADWALFREAGVAHLMSISGLHVTMFSWLAGLVIGAVWRRHPRWPLRLPAPLAARWGGLASAAGYAMLAGFGVPAQRTLWMLATAVLLDAGGRRWPWPLVLLASGVVVSAVDPWALLQPGFWLSFVAVGLLLGSTPVQAAPSRAAGTAVDSRAAEGEASLVACAAGAALPGTAGTSPAGRAGVRDAAGGAATLLREALRTQAVVTVGLTPLTLLFFHQVSVVGVVANLVAIPLVSLVVTPLALLGALLPWAWTLAAQAVAGLLLLLEVLVRVPGATWTVPAAPAWAGAAGLVAGALAVLPLPWRLRLAAVPLALPLLWPVVDRPPAGHFELLVADVGQGGAVLVRTHRHNLLYDAGPAYAPGSDAGERVLLPLLRALGVHRLDRLVLSHGDSDHVGGAAALQRALPIGLLVHSLAPGHPLVGASPAAPCGAGQRWQWDGVAFEILAPAAAAQAETPGTKANARSCVLRIEGGGRSALLTGDIERAQELALVDAHAAPVAGGGLRADRHDAWGRGEPADMPPAAPMPLRSELVLVPHHGSRTSSSEPFLDAVAPRIAIAQAGYRNRFGHPAAAVVERYRRRGTEWHDSAACGAFRWPVARAGSGPGTRGECERERVRRYWHRAPSQD